MLRSGPAARLTVHLSSTALWHHRPVYAEIVHRAHRFGLAGATVLHGTRLEHQGPCAVVVVDEEAQIRAFLETLDDILVVTGVALLERVEVYRPGSGTA